jgi:hypothetical protein
MIRFSFLAAAASVAGASVGLYVSPALAAEVPVHNKPALVEAIAGSSLKKVTLTPKAAERLGVQIDEVREDMSGHRIVPYTAVLYDLTGGAWVYVHSDPMAFVRQSIKIDTIKGNNVYLSDGPSLGTKVLAAAVPQVFGTEKGVGH